MLIITTIVAVVLAIIAVLFLKNSFFGEKTGNVNYLKKGDAQAQVSYDEEKNPKKPSFSAKELLEMSWKFLYDITEIILYKFTARAKKEVHQCGRELVNSGAKYQHTIDYSPIIASHSKQKEDSKNEVQR